MFRHFHDGLLRWPKSLFFFFYTGPRAPRPPCFHLWGRLSDRRHRPIRTSSLIVTDAVSTSRILAPSPASNAQWRQERAARLRPRAPARHRENRRWLGHANTTAAKPSQLHRCGAGSVLRFAIQRARASVATETRRFHTHKLTTAACGSRFDTASRLLNRAAHSALARGLRIFLVQPTQGAVGSDVQVSTPLTFAQLDHYRLLLVALFFCILPLAYPPWVNGFWLNTHP